MCALTVTPVESVGGGLVALPEESELKLDEFRTLVDASIEDARTIRFPPGDTRLNATAAAAAIRLIAEFNLSSGTRKRYVKADATLYDWNFANTFTATSLTALDSGSIPGWTVHNDKFILCDAGGNFIGNGTVFGPLGADAPTAPTGTPSAGAGLSAGAYLYKASLYSSVLDEESSLSSASSTVTTSGGNLRVSVSGLPTLDAIWDNVRVYRTTVGGGTYYLHSTRASAATFTDSTSDVTISANATAPSTDTVRPGAAKFAEIHMNRLWLNPINDPDALRFSAVGEPWNFPTANRIVFNVKDGDNITGMWTRQGRLFVAKQNRIFILSGDTTATFELFENEVGVGIRAPRATTTIQGATYAMDMERGPWRKDVQLTEPIGVRQRDLFRVLDGTRSTHFVGGHEPTSRAWWVAVCSTLGGSANDKVYSFHYETGKWCEIRLPGVGAFGEVHDSNGRLRLVYGTDDGFCHLVDRATELRSNLGNGVTGTPKATGTTTRIDVNETLTTTGNGWSCEYLTVVFRNSSGLVTSIERKKVSGNNAGDVTATSAFSRAPTTTDTWFLGAFWLEALSGKMDLGDKEARKHVPYWRLSFERQSHTVDLYGALVIDDETAPDSKLAAVRVDDRAAQRFPAVRGGGGRRPLHVAVRIAAVSSAHPQRVKGWAISHRPAQRV